MKKLEFLNVPSMKLSCKQKLILDVLHDEFTGSAFGPALLDCSENEDLQKLTINEITWHILRLRENGLVTSEKLNYKGRVLNKYSITPVVIYEGIEIK